MDWKVMRRVDPEQRHSIGRHGNMRNCSSVVREENQNWTRKVGEVPGVLTHSVTAGIVKSSERSVIASFCHN